MALSKMAGTIGLCNRPGTFGTFCEHGLASQNSASLRSVSTTKNVGCLASSHAYCSPSRALNTKRCVSSLCRGNTKGLSTDIIYCSLCEDGRPNASSSIREYDASQVEVAGGETASEPNGSPSQCNSRKDRHVARRLTLAASGILSAATLFPTYSEQALAEVPLTTPLERQLSETASPLLRNSSPNPITSLLASDDVPSSPDTTITDKVFLEFSLCPSLSRSDRTLGDPSAICDDGKPLGRVVIGLYGKQVPQTADNFKAMVNGTFGSSYKGSTVDRILQGQFIQAGRQGSLDRGGVEAPKELPRNRETVSSAAFQLGHSRPGTVSLCLGTNDDDDSYKLDAEYRNVEFLITTGPGPAPQLDNGNVVFGTVLEGMDVVSAIASVPTYKPSDNIKSFNMFAQFLGDDRASKGRTFWNRPLKPIVISDCGVLA
eukprot:TRINITY_DN32339_c0_g1_i1.p1 TRINITY_DN32339_c0_g1~~TRINITY_DN32339_c0_g1_i1.p1  ORF type:complete len:431 (+),score=24.69 TRINITY_DN32339_c0_g1_i1:178-1470(+)